MDNSWNLYGYNFVLQEVHLTIFGYYNLNYTWGHNDILKCNCRHGFCRCVFSSHIQPQYCLNTSFLNTRNDTVRGGGYPSPGTFSCTLGYAWLLTNIQKNFFWIFFLITTFVDEEVEGLSFVRPWTLGHQRSFLYYFFLRGGSLCALAFSFQWWFYCERVNFFGAEKNLLGSVAFPGKKIVL